MLGEQILTETLEDLDFFEKIKTKLFGSPDRAADKLVAALEKVSKIYLLINSMLTMYLSLEFDHLFIFYKAFLKRCDYRVERNPW